MLTSMKQQPKHIEMFINGHKIEGFDDSDNVIEMVPDSARASQHDEPSIVTIFGMVNGKRTRIRRFADSCYRIHKQGSRVIEPSTGREGIFMNLKSTLADTTMVIKMDNGTYFEADILDMEELI